MATLTQTTRSTGAAACLTLAALLMATGTGCQVSIGGQTLPSGYYFSDDVQYFAEGPEFKLSNEAAAMQRYKAEQEQQRLGGRP